MYEQFGAFVPLQRNPDGKTTVEFRVFFPNATQYVAAGDPRIKHLKVIGTFQTVRMDPATGLNMLPADYSPTGKRPLGTLYKASLDLAPGYYEYQYRVEFDNGDVRTISDPCARYGGEQDDRAAFVVGGEWPDLVPMANRRPLRDLIIYELMIDDFAAELMNAQPNKAPLELVQEKINYIADEIGANAIEFMPWTAWRNHDFSWGYNPAYYFSVEARYMRSPGRALDKLALLREVINACHAKGIEVIMDGVFNHAEGGQDGGFPYLGLYEQELESPYVGTFAGGGFFKNLDFNNECTHEFVFDVCRYWIEEFGIDGIRFDYTMGFWHSDDRGHGLSRLMFDLKHYLRDKRQQDFKLILEHLSDNRYEAINATNQVHASACWFDPFMYKSWDYLDRYNKTDGKGEILDLELLRIYDARREFDDDKGPITYVQNHDHRGITKQCGGRDKWPRIQPYLIALFTAPGSPLIYNGQELGIENDMPESGDGRVKARPIDWNLRWDDAGKSIFALYHKLIKIRTDHPALRTANVAPRGQQDWARDLDPKGFGVSRNQSLAVFHRWGPPPVGAGEARYVVVMNFSNTNQRFRLEFPRQGWWEDLLSGWRLEIGGDQYYTLEVGSNWGHIFYWAP